MSTSFRTAACVRKFRAASDTSHRAAGTSFLEPISLGNNVNSTECHQGIDPDRIRANADFNRNMERGLAQLFLPPWMFPRDANPVRAVQLYEKECSVFRLARKTADPGIPGTQGKSPGSEDPGDSVCRPLA
jgi:hypothetical protein